MAIEKQKSKFVDLYSLGECVDISSLLVNLPEKLMQTCIPLLRLDGKKVTSLTRDQRHAINAAIGSRNKIIIRECMELGYIDPSWSPELRYAIERKRQPRRRTTSMSGYAFNLLIASAGLSKIEPAALYS